MNVLSLFDGISCGMLALRRAGIKVDKYFASEIDKFAIAVSKKNFPEIVHVGDVRNVFAKDFPKIDLIIGGSPCQGLSVIGKRLGFDDDRSKLFYEFVRAVNEFKPRYFLLENVRMKTEWSDEITRQLGVSPIMIDSRLVSAQNRKRLYWTNIPGVEQPKDKGIVLDDVIQDTDEGHFDNWKKYTDGTMPKYWNPYDRNPLYEKSTTLRDKHHYGNMWIRTKSVEGYRRLTMIERERLQNLPDNYTDCVSMTQRVKATGNCWTVDVIAHIFSYMKDEQWTE